MKIMKILALIGLLLISTSNMAYSNEVNFLNNNELVRTITQGYEKVGIKIGDNQYVVQMKEDEVFVDLSNDQVDYYITVDADDLFNLMDGEINDISMKKYLFQENIPSIIKLKLAKYYFSRKIGG